MGSIICNVKECYICGAQRDLELHHCIHGTANRKKADQDGLVVWLCHSCHADLHDRGNHDLELQQIAQLAWMDHVDDSIDAFRERYGKTFL